MANPLYEVWLTEKDNTKSRTKIGVAFGGPYETISLLLGPGVVIDAQVRESCWITLKPCRESKGSVGYASGGVGGASSGADGDIPFG